MRRLWRVIKEWVSAVWVLGRAERGPKPCVADLSIRRVTPCRDVLIVVPGGRAHRSDAVKVQGGYFGHYADDGRGWPVLLEAEGRVRGLTREEGSGPARWYPLSEWMPCELEELGFVRVGTYCPRWIAPEPRPQD